MNHHLNISLPLALILSLSACAAHQALDDMKQAKASYHSCLAANLKNPAACKREKEAYEAAGQDYDSMGGHNLGDYLH